MYIASWHVTAAWRRTGLGERRKPFPLERSRDVRFRKHVDFHSGKTLSLMNSSKIYSSGINPNGSVLSTSTTRSLDKI